MPRSPLFSCTVLPEKAGRCGEVSKHRSAGEGRVVFGVVQTSAKVVPEDVIRNLQATLPPMPAQPQSYIELENVPPWLLLAPVQPHSHIASDLAGGGFDLGDRVVTLSASGSRPLKIPAYIWGPSLWLHGC